MDNALFDQFRDFSREVADRTAPLVKKWGWDRDDCRQHAALVLWQLASADGPPLPGSIPAAKGYLFTTIRRAIVRAAKKHRLTLTDADPTLLTLVSKPDRSFAEKLETLLNQEDTPANIRGYVRLRVFQRMTARNIADTLRVPLNLLSDVRRQATDWLFAQVEDGRLS